MSPPQPRERYEFRVTADDEAGVYANLLRVWHTAHEFTLDFAATLPTRVGRDEDGNPVTIVPCRVTARVRMPPSVIFRVLRALNDNMTRYESRWGPIQHPGEDAPLVVPDDLIGRVGDQQGDEEAGEGDEGRPSG